MARPRKKPAGRGKRPDLSVAMWKGARLEQWHYTERDEICFDLPPARIAEIVNKTRQAVVGWRKNERYRQGMMWLACQRASETFKKPYKRMITDPAEGAKHGGRGLVFKEGCWQEPDE